MQRQFLSGLLVTNPTNPFKISPLLYFPVGKKIKVVNLDVQILQKPHNFFRLSNTQENLKMKSRYF
jgi:hypothetical protein